MNTWPAGHSTHFDSEIWKYDLGRGHDIQRVLLKKGLYCGHEVRFGLAAGISPKGYNL